MNKINVKKTSLMIVLFASFILTYLFVGVTFAWLSGTYESNPTINIGNFEARILPKCNDVNLYNVQDVFNQDKKTLVLTGTSKAKLTTEEQVGKYFIEDLNISLIVNSDIHAYLRVKVETEWLLTRTFLTIQKDPLIEAVYTETVFPYHLYNVGDPLNPSTDWYFDDLTNYLYYKPVITEGLHTINFITGCDGYNTSSTRSYKEDCTTTIGVKVELVQANRAHAIWGLTSFPWEDNA